VVDLVLQGHGDGGLVNASDPRVAQGFTDSVPLSQVELRESVEEILGQVGQVAWVVELVHCEQFGPVSFSIVNEGVVKRVLASVK